MSLLLLICLFILSIKFLFFKFSIKLFLFISLIELFLFTLLIELNSLYEFIKNIF